MQTDKSSKLSIPEFDDISHISSCSSISKQNKREELRAIKNRLAKVSILTAGMTPSVSESILPRDI